MAGALRHCQPDHSTLLEDRLGGLSTANYKGLMAKSDKDRAERLAAALRENLRKRKAQARAAADQKSEPTQPASE